MGVALVQWNRERVLKLIGIWEVKGHTTKTGSNVSCACAPVRATSPQFFGTQQQFSARSLQADRQLDIWTTDCQVHENTGRWFWRWIFGNMKKTIYPYFLLASLSTFWQSGDTLRCDSLWILALYQPVSTLVVREPSQILVPELKGFKWWNVASRYDIGNMMIWLNMVQWFSKNQLVLVKRIEQVDVWSFISFTFTFTDSFLWVLSRLELVVKHLPCG